MWWVNFRSVQKSVLGCDPSGPILRHFLPFRELSIVHYRIHCGMRLKSVARAKQKHAARAALSFSFALPTWASAFGRQWEDSGEIHQILDRGHSALEDKAEGPKQKISLWLERCITRCIKIPTMQNRDVASGCLQSLEDYGVGSARRKTSVLVRYPGCSLLQGANAVAIAQVWGLRFLSSPFCHWDPLTR